MQDRPASCSHGAYKQTKSEPIAITPVKTMQLCHVEHHWGLTVEVTLILRPGFQEGASCVDVGEGESMEECSGQRAQEGPGTGTVCQCSRNIKE